MACWTGTRPAAMAPGGIDGPLGLSGQGIGEKTTVAESKDQRRFARWKQPEKAEITIGGGAPAACTVLDFSPGGLRLTTRAPLAEGMAVTLTLDDLPPFKARVVYVDGECYGVAFADGLQYVFR